MQLEMFIPMMVLIPAAGGRLAKLIVKKMNSHQISEETFISGLYEIIINIVDFQPFYDNLKKELA
jgi:hypothetical protein